MRRAEDKGEIKMAYFKSRLHKMIGSEDPQKVEQYRQLASTHDIDPDHVFIVGLMIDKQMSPYEAATHAHKSRLTNKSHRQLYRIAQTEREIIYAHFGWPTLDDLWASLMKGEDVEIFPDEMETIVSRCMQKETPVKMSLHLDSERFDLDV